MPKIARALLDFAECKCTWVHPLSHISSKGVIPESGYKLWISQLNSLLMLLYEKDAGAREREITLTALALNRLISVHRDSPFLIASSSSFVASSRCEPD